MEQTHVATRVDTPDTRAPRLHYLDWLRLLATFGVFLFHAVHPFDHFDWEIKNAQQSVLATLFIAFLAPWGMPFFFFMAGTASWFALRRRSGRQYLRERVQRLLVPFVVGSLLLSPPQLYLQWRHRVETGLFTGTMLEFLSGRKVGFAPTIFGWAGYHLWFVGFLFAYSVIGLPVFLWLKREAGQRLVAWVRRLCQARGGVLLLALPMMLLQIVLRPFFPGEHDWGDFALHCGFFVYGYMLYADGRFSGYVQRDWPLSLAVGIICSLFILALGALDVGLTWMSTPSIPGFYVFWLVWALLGWAWTLFMLHVGMRSLDFTNRVLRYGGEAGLPFFLLHQPVIIAIAYFVVQWDAGVGAKLPVVVLGSFAVTLGLYELLIRRTDALRRAFGMRPTRKRPDAAA